MSNSIQMSLSTNEIVIQILRKDPLLQNFLSKGIINYSALAREMLPQVKKSNTKAKMESVLIAIQRYVTTLYPPSTDIIHQILSRLEVRVTSDILQLVIERTKRKEQQLYSRILEQKGDVCILTQNSQQIGLFISKHIYPTFSHILSKGDILTKNLAVIGLHETGILGKHNSLDTPGFLAHLCLLFAQNGISIVELVSCHEYILIFVKEKDAMVAYELIIKQRSQ